MKKGSIVRTIAEIGIFAAIGFVLDEVQGALSFSFTAGGSIGFAMVAVLIMAYRRGFLPAIFTGLIMGLLDISTKAYIVHWAQLFLDYILPYALVGIAGLFKPFFDKTDNRNVKIMWLIIGTVVGGLLKFFSHFFAGIFFWNNTEDFVWGLNYMSPALYSFIYNIAFIGPSIILCAGLMLVLFLRAPKVIMTEGESNVYVVSEEKKQLRLKYVLSSSLIAIGLFIFIFFLVKYIGSFKNKSGEGYIYYKLDRDSMVIFAAGFALVISSLNQLLKINKNKFKYSVTCLATGIIVLAFSLYGLAKVLEMYIDSNTDINNLYWAWFTPSFIVGISLIVSYFLIRKKEENKPIISTN